MFVVPKYYTCNSFLSQILIFGLQTLKENLFNIWSLNFKNEFFLMKCNWVRMIISIHFLIFKV